MSPSGMLGCERAPHSSSILKNESPARTVRPVVLGTSCSKDPESTSVTTSHLVGWAGSTRSGVRSQSCDDVVGGRLHFMLPLRSITKSAVTFFRPQPLLPPPEVPLSTAIEIPPLP